MMKASTVIIDVNEIDFKSWKINSNVISMNHLMAYIDYKSILKPCKMMAALTVL